MGFAKLFLEALQVVIVLDWKDLLQPGRMVVDHEAVTDVEGDEFVLKKTSSTGNAASADQSSISWLLLPLARAFLHR